MSQKIPIVAIVGRANVGKSSLFNCILKRREAIVAREAGTTRDNVTAIARYKDHNFWLVDTAGIKDPEDDFEFTIQEQIIQAADSADLILVVVEAPSGVSEEDRQVAKLALKSGKPVILIVNKIDQTNKLDLDNFSKLGIKEIVYTSATQTRGINELLDTLIKHISKTRFKQNVNLTISLVGRPNVGKSLLFNSLAKKQQAIVSSKAGTTRDINRINVRYKSKNIQLLDTAGIRRSGKIKVGVEKFSVLRTLYAIEQSDICLQLMDVSELNVQLDQKIAGMVKDSGKGLILVVAKWDSLIEKDAYTWDSLAKEISQNYLFVPWAPLIFTSAITGQNVTKIYDIAFDIYKNRQKFILTNKLNKWLKNAIINHPPAGLKNRSPKLNYMVQEKDNPTPSFKIFGSLTKYLHWSYKRYLEKDFRQNFNFEGTPIKFWFIEKHISHKHGVKPKAVSK